MLILVFRLFCIMFPHTECFYCFRSEQTFHCLMAFGWRQCYLFINEVVVEAYGGSIFTVVGIVDMVEMCPIYSTQAHGARFA